MPPKRYFEELAKNERFKPGVVSDELRKAIGLHDDKIPIWIYRMRVLGYPPGWLKVADMSKTVVPIYDGSEFENSHVSAQEGTYNVESLIVYPGFNAPIPPGVNDDWEMLRMPPMQKHQQLDFATATMKRPQPIPYKRLRISLPEEKKTDLDESLDSALGTSSEVATPLKAEMNPDEVLMASPEKKKTKLLSVGSPIPDSYIVDKPPLEKWSENNTLADLIYFENLPNYTGVFDKMRSVLGGVRNKLFNKPASVDSPQSPTTSSLSQTSQGEETAITIPSASNEASNNNSSEVVDLTE